MKVKVTADSIQYLVDHGMAQEVASEIKRLEEENRKLFIIATQLRDKITGDNFWTIELDSITRNRAN